MSTFIWKGGWFHLPYLLGDINHDEQVNECDRRIVARRLHPEQCLA